MITQQAPPGAQCLLQAAGRREPETLCRGSVLIPSYGHSSRFGHEADHLIAPPTDPNAKMTSVSAGQLRCGAPRRNRTGDPILTKEPPGTAVRTAISPGHTRPSGPQLSVLFRRSYALSFNPICNGALSLRCAAPGQRYGEVRRGARCGDDRAGLNMQINPELNMHLGG